MGKAKRSKHARLRAKQERREEGLTDRNGQAIHDDEFPIDVIWHRRAIRFWEGKYHG